MAKGNILLIEDDELLGATLSENLTLEGHAVVWVKDGQEGINAALQNLHDLIVLDLMLPNKTGFEILSEYRQENDKPVLIISAKNLPEDRIKGLELRADDYLDKPFHLKEFLLRVQALLRRKSPPTELDQEEIQLGNAIINFKSHSITSQSGDTDALSDKECKVLRVLISRPNTVISRQEILDLAWGFDEFPSTRTVDNFIVKFRKWIENNPSEPTIIRSQRGVGYIYVPEIK